MSYKFDIDKYLQMAAEGKKLEEVAIKVVCAKLKEIFCKENNVIYI